MKKVFSTEEIAEIMKRRSEKQESSAEENSALRIVTRSNKKWVKAQSTGDYSRLYLFPSYTSKDGMVWHKMLDFSALFYVYELAPRMGRTANVFDDKDSYAKSKYIASISDIQGVAEDFLELGGKKVEVTLNGIYIFTLDMPRTADDFSKLMRVEEERRDRTRNMMRPAKMAPVTYKMMVDFITQISPKIKNLERRDFFSVGEDIVRGLEKMLEVYYMYSDGYFSMTETGERLLALLNRIKAGMTILQEMSAWDSIDTAAMLGEYLMLFRDQILTDFKIKVGKLDNVNDKSRV